MTNSAPKLTRQVIIVNELGLHARSAAKIAKISGRSKASKADAASILDILTLECEKGSQITIGIENKADSDILESIVELVEKGFGE